MSETAHQHAREQQPLVSIVIPAYNVEGYIARAIESTLQQSISNIEVIVVDDASKDGTLSIAQDFANRDSRVTVIARPENAGSAAARNVGLDAATGEWVCPLDADDWFSPTRLSALLDSVQEPSIDMVADDFYLVDYDSLEPETTFSKLNDNVYDRSHHITASSYVNQSNKVLGHGSSPGFLKALIRRSFLNDNGIRYRETLRVTHDFFLYLDCLIAGARFSFFPEPHYYYLLRPGSLSRRNDEGKLERSRLFIEELRARLQDERTKVDPDLKSALSHKLRDCEMKLQYRAVALAFHRKQYLQALGQVLKSPLFLVRFLKSISSQTVGKNFI
ncbi:MAG: glycosyltransferase family 2 protein [Cyanobacteria bacterium P01_E01_bin.34]